MLIKDWSWWKLFTKVQPLLDVHRTEEELKNREVINIQRTEDNQSYSPLIISWKFELTVWKNFCNWRQPELLLFNNVMTLKLKDCMRKFS